MLVSTKRFSYKDGKFTAFISDLGADFRFERIYQDACDVGLELLSDKTGKVAKFYLANTERSGAGEVESWLLRPIIGSVQKNLTLKGVEMVLFND